MAENLFRQIEDELEAVDVEGWQALALRSTVEPMQRAATSGVVRLLPMFDAYALDSGRIGDPVLAQQHWKQVYRSGGWTTAVVLVDGIIKGVWDYQMKDIQMTITVEMFDPPTQPIQTGIEAEAGRMAEFFGTAVVLEYGPIN